MVLRQPTHGYENKFFIWRKQTIPHYSSGTEAKVGDIVHGKGYNVPYEITGVVVSIIPNSESCNIQVAHATRRQFGLGTIPMIDVEYGETKAFEKVA